MTDPATLRVLTSRPSHLARIVSGALQAEGIEVVLERDALAQVYALDTGRHATRLYVREDQFEAAQALIREIESDDR